MMLRLLRACVAVSAALLAFTACGEDVPPGERVPDLARQLDRVDAAIESGRYEEARSAVEDLVNTTAQAEVGGEVSDDEADRILDAAAALLEELPLDDRQDSAEGSGSPSPSLPAATPPADEDPDEGEESDDEGSEGEGEGESEGNGNGGGNGSEGEGGGNGPSGENGPDDGHGN
jgi:hypothetical protein